MADEARIEDIIMGGIMVHMKGDTGSYHISEDKVFTVEHPFMLLDFYVAEMLINEIPERFEYATQEEVKAFYGLEKS